MYVSPLPTEIRSDWAAYTIKSVHYHLLGVPPNGLILLQILHFVFGQPYMFNLALNDISSL